MKLKDFVSGVLTGVAAGIVVSKIVDQVDPNIAAESVLKSIKDFFKEEGPIDGSWIVMKPEPFQNKVIKMDVYRGGVSRIMNGEIQQFEFAANAKTGTVVELTKI